MRWTRSAAEVEHATSREGPSETPSRRFLHERWYERSVVARWSVITWIGVPSRNRASMRCRSTSRGYVCIKVAPSDARRNTHSMLAVLYSTSSTVPSVSDMNDSRYAARSLLRSFGNGGTRLLHLRPGLGNDHRDIWSGNRCVLLLGVVLCVKSWSVPVVDGRFILVVCRLRSLVRRERYVWRGWRCPGAELQNERS